MIKNLIGMILVFASGIILGTLFATSLLTTDPEKHHDALACLALNFGKFNGACAVYSPIGHFVLIQRDPLP